MKKTMKMVLAVATLVCGWSSFGALTATEAVQARLDTLYPGQGWIVSNVNDEQRFREQSGSTVLTHPTGKDLASASVLSCAVQVTGVSPSLKLGLSSTTGGGSLRDWLFIAKIDGIEVTRMVIKSTSTVYQTIPLSGYIGKKVKIELVNAAGGDSNWSWEDGHWDSIEFIGMAGLVEITSATQTPGSGKATINYMVSGLKTATKTDIVIKASANGKSTSKTIANVGNGSGSVEIDYKTALGAAPNVAFSAELTDPDVEGVQLWKDGPYWATCNVGVDKPEYAGYYFWWGDTVGYWWTNSKWTSVWNSSTTIQFYDTTANPANKTFNKNVSTLTSNGYLDASGNLASWCDAATAHLGAPWRMPTKAEFEALAANCTATWTTLNGVYGRRFTGKGDYASKSIFLPAAGYGCVAGLGDHGRIGDYWSSSAGDNTSGAYMMQHVTSESLGVGGCDRRFGFPIRAVRTFTK